MASSTISFQIQSYYIFIKSESLRFVHLGVQFTHERTTFNRNGHKKGPKHFFLPMETQGLQNKTSCGVSRNFIEIHFTISDPGFSSSLVL
jgi:fatty acid-binding protein DegV